MHEHDPTTSSTHERRGRPLVLPVDGSAPTDLWYEPWPRMAWVLVTSRLAGADRTLVQREALVERLRDLGVAADLSRVSRWESGRQPVPAHVLSAYETVLG